MDNTRERGARKPRKWRVIFDGAHSGARNMATDEALARIHLESESPPTLRFYAWEPGCLSIGRVQKLDGPLQVLEERRAGLDWVRRPSGGRGVWHHAEVTYSISLGLEHLPPEARSIVGAYAWMSRPLLRGLESLGVRAEIASSQAHSKHEDNCFLSASQADAVVDGRKLIGGAQCRFEENNRTAILQHGSILIALDAREWARALGEPLGEPVGEEDLSEPQRRMESRMLSLHDLGIRGATAEVRARVQEAIVRALGEESEVEVEVEVEVERSSLSEREAELRDGLERGKYLQGSWNRRGRLGIAES